MNFILNLGMVIIAFGFAGLYIYNLIINLIRAIKVNKVIKTNPKYVVGKVIEVDKQ